MAAAAARARVTGTLVKGMEGPPPLPSSAVSQIFVVGGGANELVVLVVVSGEHGGNSGQGQGWVPPSRFGVSRGTLFPLAHQICAAPPVFFLRLMGDHCTHKSLLRTSKK